MACRAAGVRDDAQEQAAAVRAVTKKPPLANYPHAGAVEMTQAEWKGTHADYKGTREAGQGARQAGFFRPELQGRDELQEHGRHRVRTVVKGGTLVSVFLTDAKIVQPPQAAEAQEAAG